MEPLQTFCSETPLEAFRWDLWVRISDEDMKPCSRISQIAWSDRRPAKCRELTLLSRGGRAQRYLGAIDFTIVRRRRRVPSCLEFVSAEGGSWSLKVFRPGDEPVLSAILSGVTPPGAPRHLIRYFESRETVYSLLHSTRVPKLNAVPLDFWLFEYRMESLQTFCSEDPLDVFRWDFWLRCEAKKQPRPCSRVSSVYWDYENGEESGPPTQMRGEAKLLDRDGRAQPSIWAKDATIVRRRRRVPSCLEFVSINQYGDWELKTFRPGDETVLCAVLRGVRPPGTPRRIVQYFNIREHRRQKVYSLLNGALVPKLNTMPL